MREVPPSLSGWAARGRAVEVWGRKLFCIDRGPTDPDVLERAGGREQATALLLLHGFPTSSHDFHHVLDRLARRHRVVVHDHLGFGLSDKPRDYSYSLLEQADHAIGLWRSLGIARAHLVAHDYGTSIATELLARRARGLELGGVQPCSLVLCNGSVHVELAELQLSQRLLAGPGPVARTFARLATQRRFAGNIQRLLGAPGSLPGREIQAMWEGLVRLHGRERLPAISSYLAERRRFWQRWIDALERFDRPTLVLWGRRDPVAVARIATRLHAEIPKAKLRWLDELGHFPMLEDPEGWAEAVTSWTASVGD